MQAWPSSTACCNSHAVPKVGDTALKMQILPLYAALLAVLFVFLSVRTLRLRRRLKIGLGDGANPEMLRAIRVHSNFAEYVPLTLMLLFLVESQGAAKWVVHALCAALVVGRLLHAFGVGRANEDFRFRVIGMAMTLTTILACAALLVAHVFW